MLTLRDYQELKAKRMAAEIPPRGLCYTCWRPEGFCYCAKIRPSAFRMRFAILIHPLEERRPIATGRMAHLCLKDSLLIEGDDYSEDEQVNSLLADERYFPVILYPGEGSIDLSKLSYEERWEIFPKEKSPLIFAVDGTWNSASRTMFRSQNLKRLPQICFTPSSPSRIRVRHQPEAHCYTTLEAIHEVIDLLSDPGLASRPQDNLLEVLDFMVARQLEFCSEPKRRDEGPRLRRSVVR